VHSLDRIRQLLSALVPSTGRLYAFATTAALVTCAAVVLNVGPFANTPNIDGLRGTVRESAAPAIAEQPNESRSVAQRYADALTPPAYQLSAVGPKNASEPIGDLRPTFSLSPVEVVSAESQPSGPKGAGRTPEVEPPRQDPVAIDPATQPHANQTSPDLTRKDTIVGIWAPDAGNCSARDFRDGVLPTVINTEGAWAGETFCIFTKKEKIEAGLKVVAKCTSPRERWTSSVHLTVSENRLTWTSNRGAQAYTRCELDVLMAHAE